MRRNVLSFLLGCIIGLTVGIALFYIAPRDEHQRAIATLDFLIDEWTAQRDASTTLSTDTVWIAQLPARVELPDARPGYFPDTVRSLAHIVERRYNIPRAVILAQFALESRWGLSNLNASNYFGHTWAAVKPFLRDTTTWVTRNEKVMRNGQIVSGPPMRFASYKNITECFDVHGRYLTQSNRYASAFAAASSEKFARKLSEANYAADPDYALKLIAIIRRHNLETMQ